jgi:hypothetical protein
MVAVDRPVIRMFAHEESTVRWETRISDLRGLELTVFGPGAQRRSYTFQEAMALVAYQVQCERQLLSNGYGVLKGSERRVGHERRRRSRQIADRRQQ